MIVCGLIQNRIRSENELNASNLFWYWKNGDSAYRKMYAGLDSRLTTYLYFADFALKSLYDFFRSDRFNLQREELPRCSNFEFYRVFEAFDGTVFGL